MNRTSNIRGLRLAPVLVLFAFGVTLGPNAWAAADMSGSWLGVPLVVWAWSNLIVFWGLLWKLAGPPLKGFLAKRKQDIADGIDRAENQAAEAERMREELAGQLQAFRVELGEQKERARIEAQREREQILAQAEAERAKLLEQTEREIENQTARARSELRSLTAGLVSELAKQQLAGSLDPTDHNRLFEEDLDRLSAWKSPSQDQSEATS